MIKNYVQNSDVNFAPASVKKRIGILGGTFNPIHTGHIDMAEKLYYEFSLDTVMFLVSGDPPHKDAKQMPSAFHRFNMVKNAIKHLSYAYASDMEIIRPGKIYTVDTLSKLKEENIYAEYFYIIGGDTLFELETWKDFKQVFSLCTFICMEREGRNIKECMRKAVSLHKEYGAKIYFSSYKGKDVSSTQIRELLKEGKSTKDMLTAEVERYIKIHGLYK